MSKCEFLSQLSYTGTQFPQAHFPKWFQGWIEQNLQCLSHYGHIGSQTSVIQSAVCDPLGFVAGGSTTAQVLPDVRLQYLSPRTGACADLWHLLSEITPVINIRGSKRKSSSCLILLKFQFAPLNSNWPLWVWCFCAFQVFLHSTSIFPCWLLVLWIWSTFKPVLT